MTLETAQQKLQQARNTKSVRLWLIAGLAVLVFVLRWFKIIKTGFAIWLGIVILAAFGIQMYDYDLDLKTLRDTGSIQASRIQHTKDGIVLRGDCVTAQRNSASDLNCANFKTQEEAQAKYDQCAEQIASYNEGKSSAEIKNLDIYGLDGDKDGTVCEALPAM